MPALLWDELVKPDEEWPLPKVLVPLTRTVDLVTRRLQAVRRPETDRHHVHVFTRTQEEQGMGVVHK